MITVSGRRFRGSANLAVTGHMTGARSVLRRPHKGGSGIDIGLAMGRRPTGRLRWCMPRTCSSSHRHYYIAITRSLFLYPRFHTCSGANEDGSTPCRFGRVASAPLGLLDEGGMLRVSSNEAMSTARQACVASERLVLRLHLAPAGDRAYDAHKSASRRLKGDGGGSQRRVSEGSWRGPMRPAAGGSTPRRRHRRAQHCALPMMWQSRDVLSREP